MELVENCDLATLVAGAAQRFRRDERECGMMRGASTSAPAVVPPAANCDDAPRASSSFSTATRLSCVVLAGLFLANCANDQVARRGKSKEIGAFPSSKYGPASARVVEDGQPVPKGGGRELIGRSYTVAGKRYTPYEKPVGFTAVGTASWYGEAFHGRRTANGEVYDRMSISAAHPTMPLPAYARVTNVTNSRSIIVRVNDRGPFHGGRVMDVSQKTADALAFRHLGTARVKIEYLGQASLAGSDDNMLLASLRTDGSPASIPGQSSRTMIASAASQVDLGRSAGPDLDEEPARPAPAPVRAEPTPVQPQPVAQAYAPEQPRSIALQSPIVASAAASSGDGVSVSGVRLPPSRPFDLGAVAHAGKPVLGLRPNVVTTPMPVPRTASPSAALEKAPPLRLAKGHPLSTGVKQQSQPLARN
ncbi:septal ring lytic transglycosylase RlpA family protein [Bosea vestrisii]|uniref:septal ring lytic transglycosylase RlpA family protein n=1 Tax=Bosea vestrisii TaxID=151416 RepID=UPI0024DF66DE|nr:septal ring lytic transglycosylase RlpA family protein [Bosea vestrisii]WID97006.1 septal ring lytic transglycosylase RlpA family protein [Bosea vestrisii]